VQVPRLLMAILLAMLGLPPAEANIATYPEAERVLSEVQGADEADVLARKHASMAVLQSAVREIYGSYSKPFPPLAGAKHGEYGSAMLRIEHSLPERYKAACKQGWAALFEKCPREAFFTASSAYASSSDFQSSLLGKYIPAPDVRQYMAIKAADAARRGATRSTATALAGLADLPTDPLALWNTLSGLSLIWLLPAGLLFMTLSVDRAETVQRTFWGWTIRGQPVVGTIDEPTGGTIKGNPSFARAVALFWTIACTLAFACLLVVSKTSPTAVKVGVPLAALVAAGLMTAWLHHDDRGLARLLAKAWWGLVALASVNLCGWLLYKLGQWLM
jgi:hypothetical protein